MAKYITVVCRVKGQTVLKLIDDFESAEDNVFYYSESEDQTHEFDLNLVKQEFIEKEEEPLDEYNDNSCDSLSEDYFDETQSFNHLWNDLKGESTDNKQSMDSYKKYLDAIKTSGKQMFVCKYESCEYQTLWKNAIVNHIRHHHLHFYPFICGYPDCGKKFAIRSNLNNHRKVHSKKCPFREGVPQEENSQSSADIDHNYSQNVVKKKSVFTQKSNQNKISFSDKKKSIPQNISKNVKKKRFGKIKSKLRSIQKKDIKEEVESDHSIDEKGIHKRRKSSTSSQKPSFVGIKSVEQYIKQTERNGLTWRSCLWPDCSYDTKYATSMVYHIRNNHLNDKPYVCLFCGKRFAMRTNLNNHKKVHKK